MRYRNMLIGLHACGSLVLKWKATGWCDRYIEQSEADHGSRTFGRSIVFGKVFRSVISEEL